jgi:hypothetical protein
MAGTGAIAGTRPPSEDEKKIHAERAKRTVAIDEVRVHDTQNRQSPQRIKFSLAMQAVD